MRCTQIVSVASGASFCVLMLTLMACSTTAEPHDRLMRSTASGIGAEIAEPQSAYLYDDPSSRSDSRSDGEPAQLTPHRDRFMGRPADRRSSI